MTIIEYTKNMAASLDHGTPHRSTIESVKGLVAKGQSYEAAVVLTAYNAKYRKDPTPPELERMLSALGHQPRPAWLSSGRAKAAANPAAAALLDLADEAEKAAHAAIGPSDRLVGLNMAYDSLKELAVRLRELAAK